MTDMTSLYKTDQELQGLKEEVRQDYWFMGLYHIAQLAVPPQDRKELGYPLLTGVLFTDAPSVKKRIEFRDARGTIVNARGNMPAIGMDETSGTACFRRKKTAGSFLRNGPRRGKQPPRRGA